MVQSVIFLMTQWRLFCNLTLYITIYIKRVESAHSVLRFLLGFEWHPSFNGVNQRCIKFIYKEPEKFSWIQLTSFFTILWYMYIYVKIHKIKIVVYFQTTKIEIHTLHWHKHVFNLLCCRVYFLTVRVFNFIECALFEVFGLYIFPIKRGFIKIVFNSIQFTSYCRGTCRECQ